MIQVSAIGTSAGVPSTMAAITIPTKRRANATSPSITNAPARRGVDA